MNAQPWPAAPEPDPASCRRCGRVTHLVSGDGPVVCRVCLFAWVHYADVVRRGPLVREMGVVQLRHAEHGAPVTGCRFCRAAQLAAAPHFDAWLRERGA